MAIELSWKTPFTTSCLHAADGIQRGLRIVDSALAEALASPTAGLQAAIALSGAPPGRMWRHLLGISGTTDVARQIAETALVKTIGRVQRFEELRGALADAIIAMQSAVRTAVPQLTDELALRERPLREQWEARGPGMMCQVASLTEASLVPEQADVLLVRPAFGGAGGAHLAVNSVRIEAVLANPHADLPEVVRLAWLLAQLELDLPRYSEEVQSDRMPHVARLAMLPAVLRAAEAVELVRYSPELIGRAITAWHLAIPPGLDAVAMLEDWWETYQLDKPPLRVALQAMDSMIGS